MECKLYGDVPPLRLPDGSDVYAVARAIPGRQDGPIAVHLVDWSDAPAPFRLTLQPAALFGNRPLKMKLLVPAAYDNKSHQSAEQARSYAALSKEIPIDGGYLTSVDIPALKPWGLLILEPDDTVRDGVWQPVILPEPGGSFQKTLRVSLASASPGASLHYTTDGSRPTAASPRYTAPIALIDSAVLQAVAVLPDGRTSRVASVHFRRLPGAADPTTPDSDPLKAHLKLWLKADARKLNDGAAVKIWKASVGEDAVAKPHRTFDGTLTQPPAYKADAMHGRPAIRFDGVDDSLAVQGFANRHLAGKPFTVFMVTQSETDGFGMCGNGIWGTGGAPRLYMQRSAFHYDKLDKAANLRPASRGPTISVFMHDGQQTISAASDGVLSEPVGGLPAVGQFGSGGNLAIPFWSGNRNCAGDVAEILVFDRKLTDPERTGVEAYLADKYRIPYVRRWE
jgi:hypothetical protein